MCGYPLSPQLWEDLGAKFVYNSIRLVMRHSDSRDDKPAPFGIVLQENGIVKFSPDAADL